MLHVVFYDPATGRIIESLTAFPASILADGRDFIVVDEDRPDYDVTHRVEDGELVEIPDVD